MSVGVDAAVIVLWPVLCGRECGQLWVGKEKRPGQAETSLLIETSGSNSRTSEA